MGITVFKGNIIGGRYCLERPLAKGGMGSVWVARHLQLDSTVAIKFMAPEFASASDARIRFEREAKASAQIKSPHVVQVHDYGMEGDVPFLVMELLDGEDLFQRLKREGRLSILATLAILTQICKGLRHAHEMDIVHRDLKPANIFLQRHHEDELVKILDFGIAKRLGSDQDATGTGSMVGSPSYMSPEQMRNSKNVDCRADLWSVGVILFRCLTGRLPFPATEIAEAVLQICVEPIAKPSSIASDLGPDVDRFFERALQRDPAKRFQSARELVDAFSMLAGVRMASADWSEFRLSLPPALPIEGPPMKPRVIVAPESSLSLSENPTLPRALSPVSAPSAATVSSAQSAIAVPPSGFLMPAPEHGGEIVTVGNTLAPAGRSHAASSPLHERRSHRVLALAIAALVLAALTGLIVTPWRSKPASETSYTDASSNASSIATPEVVAPPPPPAVLPTSGTSVAPTSSSPRVPIEATVTSGQSVMAKPSAMPSVRTTVQQPNKPPLPAPPLKATKTNSTLGF